MKSEMDLMKFTTKERLCWLMANRWTLLMVGLVWVGLIIRDLIYGFMPMFLIVMVPVLALFRIIVYYYFKHNYGSAETTS